METNKRLEQEVLCIQDKKTWQWGRVYQQPAKSTAQMSTTVYQEHKPEGEKQGEHVGKNNMRGIYDDAQLCVCTAEQKQLGSL